jgi:acyl dehydratase
MSRQELSMNEVAGLTFDSLQVGSRFELGSCLITRADVLEFASRYDPQPQHLSDAGAQANPLFERISASGWHTVALMNRMIGPLFERTAIKGLAGAGVESLRWIEPVYGGDTIRVSMEIVGVRLSRSNPERGFITMRVDAQSQLDRPVATFTLTGVFERRPKVSHIK